MLRSKAKIKETTPIHRFTAVLSECYSNANTRFQSFFTLITNQPSSFASS
jgi:hypothetical protein